MTWKTLLPLVLVAPFAFAFGYAALHEYRRHRREGPVDDWREAFEFDEDAPGYEAPEEARESGAGTAEDDSEAAPGSPMPRQTGKAET